MLRADDMDQTALFTILVVDDERNIRRTLKMVLESENYRVLEAESAEQALTLVEDETVHCILLDLKLPGMSGMEALQKLQAMRGHDSNSSSDAGVPVIVISGHGTVNDAVQATKLGAFDFIEKPLDRERVLITLRNAMRQQRLTQEMGILRRELSGRFEMIGNTPGMKKLFDEIAKVAPTRGRVLITGESGTGKELIARAVHDHSQVAQGPFVKINCAAIAPELIESELFGHEKGAFTGASARKRGQFEIAHGGTLFMDEIGDMSLSSQAKVLRVLQTGELTRVGGEKPIQVDVRVVAATNKDLAKEVEAGHFREDLYFRLNVVPLRAPALRERLEDIPIMVQHFLAQFCRENGLRQKRVDPDVITKLQQYHWPGNVRELKNLMERLVIMSDDVIVPDDLPSDYARVAKIDVDLSAHRNQSLRDFKDEMERQFILARLEENQWNISRTAEILGLERTNLHKKLKAFGIHRGTD